MYCHFISGRDLVEFGANGISKVGSILDVAVNLGLLEKRGSWFSFDGEQLGQGRDQTKAVLAASPELQQKLTDRIRETLARDKAPAEKAPAEKAPAAE